MSIYKLRIDNKDCNITYLPFCGQNSRLSLAITNRYIEKDKKPWFSIMGEFHFSRYSEKSWEKELLKMKSGGVEIVSTYLFWIYHEEIEGEFDWSGNRNLRKFIEICNKLGLYVFLRIGPWVHAECRNGGFPDWLLQKGFRLRTDDDGYLKYVERWFCEIKKQVDGFLFDQNGPIIGIQIENELYDNKEHIVTLKRLANKIGLKAPIYTVTGWGPGKGAAYPKGEVIPLFGGYPEAPWEQHTDELPPNPNFFFTENRNDVAIGKDLMGNIKVDESSQIKNSEYPFLTCELGGGNQKTYHRRPYIDPNDVAALTLTKLGSGCNFVGYYMYHGGTHPIGKLSTMQESRETFYPNDCPIKSYDFQAPIGQFGNIRRHYHILRNIHNFLHDFGEILAPMKCFLPDKMPENIYDTQTARIALRSDGSCGFIFFNNYQRNPKLKPTEMLQVEIENGNKKEIVPLEPISVPSDAYFFIPWNLPLCDHKLFYSTTQPICRIDDEKRSLTIYVFKECKGITPEYVFHGDISKYIENKKGCHQSEVIESFTRIYDLNCGIENPIVIKSNNSNRKIQIITLSEDQAERCFKVYLNGKERLAICKTHNIYTQNNTINVYGIELEGELLIYPCHNETINIKNMKCRSLKIEDNILYVQFGFENIKCSFDVKEVDFEKSKYDKYLFMEEYDEPYKKQYMISIDLDKNARKVDDLLLEIDYVGDVMQAILNDEPVNDDFYDGFNKFYVSLKDLDYPERIKIKISPLHKGKKIYLQKWPKLDGNRISRIENIRILPVFKGQIEFEDKI